MAGLLLAFASLLALSGCALRPRYADFVSPSTPGEKVTFVLTEKGTGRPLPNVPVEMSELRTRVRVTTAADGTFSLPVNATYLKENPVIVVAVPRGVSGYELALVTPAPAPAPVAPEAPVPSPTPRPAPPAAVPAPAASPTNG